jgi:acyl-CoA synthetase (AMP-forming)/AMP-acid ligase II
MPPMATPVTSMLAPILRPARAATAVGASASVIGRSGLLGPYPPWRLAAAGAAVRRYGVRLGAVYAIGAALHGERIAAEDEQGASTFAEMEARTSTVAAALADSGIRAGDEVAVLCRNHRGFLTATVALGKLGADTVYLNTGFAGPQLVEVARREGAKAVILDEEFLPLAADLEGDIPLWVAYSDRRDGPSAHPSFDDLLVGSPRPAPPKAAREARQIILTSGTTGAPKGAQRSFGSELEPVVSLLSRIPLRTRDTTVVAAPMFHSWGLVNAAIGLALGARLILPRRFDPEQTLRLIAEHRAAVLVAVPVMIQRIMALPEETRRRYDTSSLRIVGLSGSALPGELATRFMDAFGDVAYNLYGSTEIGWASIADPADLRAAPGTAGRVPLGAEVRILDESGRPIGAGASGRIFVRSGLLFDGYTGGGGKEIVDGFMSTGDVGHFDAEGRLFVDGRDDDMIVSGGENVFPREVEDLLSDHPDVADAAVVGVPDDDYGQRLVAYVVATDGKDGGDELASRLRSYVGEHLARYKVPREVRIIDELPRNATGKVLKRELRDAGE